jgi:hypothetical protein
MFKNETRMLSFSKRQLLEENKNAILFTFLIEKDINNVPIIFELFNLEIIDDFTFLSKINCFYKEKIKDKDFSKEDARIILLSIFNSEKINNLKKIRQHSEVSSFKILILDLIKKAEIKNNYIKDKINLFLLEIS